MTIAPLLDMYADEVLQSHYLPAPSQVAGIGTQDCGVDKAEH